jgi:5'-nucleotidase
VRILVTNDDGVHAPGLAALTRALAGWAADDPATRQVVVVAPQANHSGAGTAVGPVYERTAVAYRVAAVEGAAGIAAYGIDGSPALSVMLSALGAFGPPPDLIVSGINLGVNVGRSVLHSGTVGAVLTGAQYGISGLAVSMKAGAATEHWDTAATVARSLLGPLADAPRRTVLNLNVPSIPLGGLRGIRRGRISGAGLLKAATDPRRAAPGIAASVGSEGEVLLEVGPAVPPRGEIDEDSLDDDAALVAAHWASLTPVVGSREDNSWGATDTVAAAQAAWNRRRS